MKTPILETSRILLRPLTLADAQTVFDNWASDPEVTKHMRFTTHETVNTTIEWLKTEEENLESGKAYNWGFVFKETNELFGSGGMYFNEEHGLFEPGYILMKKYWGMGLATEAATAIVSFAVNELRQKKLYCCHAKGNLASGRVIEKLGFVYTGEGKFTKLDGTIVNSKEYIYNV